MEPQRRRIKEMEVMVADVVVETPDTVTLVLFTGNDRLEYKPGHFLTIDPHQFEALAGFTTYLEDQKGKKEPPRAYSMCSIPDEQYLAVTVKEEPYVRGMTKYPPLLSPLLVRWTRRGTRMKVVGFTGPYTLPDDIESKTDHLVHVCAGSGSVPNFAILKHALIHHPKLRQTFLYSNKTWADVIFKGPLGALARQHGDRFKLVHTLTREAERTNEFRKGRIDKTFLGETVPDPTAAIYYACGPAITIWDKQAAKAKGEAPAPRFLETVIGALREIGVTDDRIKRESYG